MGRMAARHVAAYRGEGRVEVVACCGRRFEPAQAFAAEQGISRAFTDFRRMLSEVPLDILSVVTHAPSHAEITIAAAEAGVPCILCEKPMATSVAEADAMISACERAEVRLSINHCRRWWGAYHRLFEKLTDGSLGQVRHLHFTCGGGRLGCNGPHAFDLMRLLTGSEAEEVVGVLDAESAPDPRGSEFDDPGGFGQILFANGARATLDMSGDLGVPGVWEITCSDGRVRVDELGGAWTIFSRGREHQAKPAHARYPIPLESTGWEVERLDIVRLTQAAVAELFSKAPLSCSGADGRTALEIAVAFHISHREGHRPVRVPLQENQRNLRLAIA